MQIVDSAFPSLSVVIPSWNQGEYIERTLLSILRQDYPGPVQVIVSDGGSTDRTVEVLKKYDARITWWSARDKGFVDAVTQGLARATGDVVAIQSSDDYYLPGAFRAMAEAFAQYPDASFVSGGEVAIDPQGYVHWSRQPTGPVTPHSILFDNVPAQHATFVRRQCLDQVGGLRREVDMCADMDLWYRVSHLRPGHYLPTYLAVYQVHPDQRTQTSTKWYDSLVRMVESCEADPRYGATFRLKEDERRNLYTAWRIGWTGQRDKAKARRLALRELPRYFSYGAGTRKIIRQATVLALLNQAKGALRRGALRVLPASVAASIRQKNQQAARVPFQDVPFEWWRA